ncbi:hypothetical protein PG985_012900 [Apiospora marii]|uniref:uncharacterized protein n=1 Tax=Apiospora marii TaxID=335849 RepID=UPI003131CDB0
MPPGSSPGQEEADGQIHPQEEQVFPSRLDHDVRPRPPSDWDEDSLQDDDTRSSDTPGYAPVPGDSSKSKSEPKSADKHSWTMEISLMALGIAAVVTSTVLLFYADGRPLTDYNFFISFNTLISILATIARTTLAFAVGSCLGQWKWNWFGKRSDTPLIFESFDDASRGPMGSFWLICRLRARHWVTIGALVTLLILGFEPFMQAVIYTEGKIITTQPQTAPSIGTSHRLDVGSTKRIKPASTTAFGFRNQRYTYASAQYRREPSKGLASAVTRGFNANDPRDAVSFICTTGNCTWPVFTSISVCSACNDVSDHLVVSERIGRDLGNIQVLGIHNDGRYITHALPDVNLTNLVEPTYVEAVGRRAQIKDSVVAAYMSAKALDNPGRTLTFAELNTMIVAVGRISAEPAYANQSRPWNQTRSTATECALYFCANAYKSEVRSGKLHEDVVASWSNRVPDSYHPIWDQRLTNTSYEEYIWNAYEDFTNYSLNTGDADYTLDDLQLQIPRAEAQSRGLPGNATLIFNITQNTLGSILPFLVSNFFQDPLVYGESDLGPIVSQTLHESDNLSATFAGTATAMSIWIRDNSNMTHAGNQGDWVLHIRVRWPYVTLPVTVVLLGCSFVFLSMWETRRLRLPPWKSDVLATLTHSLDVEAREQLRAAALQGRMRERAKGMVLSFEDDAGKGLQLREQDRRPSA